MTTQDQLKAMLEGILSLGTPPEDRNDHLAMADYHQRALKALLKAQMPIIDAARKDPTFTNLDDAQLALIATLEVHMAEQAELLRAILDRMPAVADPEEQFPVHVMHVDLSDLLGAAAPSEADETYPDDKVRTDAYVGRAQPGTKVTFEEGTDVSPQEG